MILFYVSFLKVTLSLTSFLQSSHQSHLTYNLANFCFVYKSFLLLQNNSHFFSVEVMNIIYLLYCTWHLTKNWVCYGSSRKILLNLGDLGILVLDIYPGEAHQMNLSIFTPSFRLKLFKLSKTLYFPLNQYMFYIQMFSEGQTGLGSSDIDRSLEGHLDSRCTNLISDRTCWSCLVPNECNQVVTGS
jgi:hypothetical protein